MNRNPTPQDYLRAGLGYGLSKNNQRRYQEMLQEEDRDNQILLKVHSLIDWAHTSYEKAKADNFRNIGVYTELTLYWDPARVLSTYRNFEKLCKYLSAERVWKKLSREQRRFIALAYEYYQSKSSQVRN